MKIRLFPMAVLLCFSACWTTPAQTKKVPKDVTISDLNFIAGQGIGASNGGSIEEVWSKPTGDSMMGMFRFVKDGSAKFYEFLLIEQTSTGLALKLRHFEPGLIGWEDKTDPYVYPLIDFENDKVVFERADKLTRLTFQKTANNTLTVIFEQIKEGKHISQTFMYQRNSH